MTSKRKPANSSNNEDVLIKTRLLPIEDVSATSIKCKCRQKVGRWFFYQCHL